MLWKFLGKIAYNFFVYKQGLYIKLGQLLSCQTYMMNKDFCSELISLQSHAPYTFTRDEHIQILSKIDSSITNVRIENSGSIAIVLKGNYKNNTVAIKVLRTNITHIIQSQYNTITLILKLLRKSFIKRWDNTYMSIIKQLNLSQEIEHLDFFKNNVSTYVTIPKVYHEVSSPDIIVMEWIEGSSLVNSTSIDTETKKNLASQFMMFLKESCENKHVHMDLHPGNVIVTHEHTLAIIDFGLVVQIDQEKGKSLIKSFRGFFDKDFDNFYNNFVKVYAPDAHEQFKTELYDKFSKLTLYEIENTTMMSFISKLLDICDKHNINVSHEFADLEFALSTARDTFLSMWNMSNKDFYNMIS